MEHNTGTGLAHVRLRHRALPERDLRDVQLETRVLGHTLAAPLLVSAMTGGTPEAAVINRRLMDAAAENGLALMLGSGRPLLEDPRLRRTYRPDGAERRYSSQQGSSASSQQASANDSPTPALHGRKV